MEVLTQAIKPRTHPLMPSSRTTAAAGQGVPDLADLLALLGSVPEPRARRGVRHPLAQLLAIGLSAVIAGARSVAAIGEWAAANAEAMAAGGGAGRAPDESTLRRVFAQVDADALAGVIRTWVWTRAAVRGARRG